MFVERYQKNFRLYHYYLVARFTDHRIIVVAVYYRTRTSRRHVFLDFLHLYYDVVVLNILLLVQ